MQTVRGGWEEGDAESRIVPIACSYSLSSAGSGGQPGSGMPSLAQRQACSLSVGFPFPFL